MNEYIHTCVNTYIHKYIYTYTHANTHTYIIHTHTYTHAFRLGKFPEGSLPRRIPGENSGYHHYGKGSQFNI